MVLNRGSHRRFVVIDSKGGCRLQHQNVSREKRNTPHILFSTMITLLHSVVGLDTNDDGTFQKKESSFHSNQ